MLYPGSVLPAIVALMLVAIIYQPLAGFVICAVCLMVMLLFAHSDVWLKGLKGVTPGIVYLTVIFGAFWLSPYTKISTETGPAEKSFSIYYHFMGLVSPWEIMLATAMLLVLLWKRRKGETLSLGARHGLILIFALYCIAFFVGTLHSGAGLLAYGPTAARRPFIALIPVLSCFACYLLVINTIENRKQLSVIFRLMRWLTVAVILIGLGRLILMVQGVQQGLWFFGLPVVLYDQMVMLYVPIFVIFLQICSGHAVRKWQWAGFALMLFFILFSTRRFNYLLLGAGLLFVYILRPRIRLASRFRWGKKQAVPLAVLVAGSGIAFATITQLRQGVTQAVYSMDMASRIGQKNSGDMRLAEVRNMLRNMEERPYTFVSGFGLGTLWRAIDYQPVDPFTRRLRISRNWYPKFHLPYISMFYRLGTAGTALFLIWFVVRSRALKNGLATVRRPLQPLALSMFIFFLLVFPSVADTFNPTSWTLCGIYLGLLEKMQEFFPKSCPDS